MKAFLFIILAFSLMYNCVSETIPVYLALRQYNIPILKDRLKMISDPESDHFGKYYSRKEITDLISPPVEDMTRIMNWLGENKITNIKNNGDMIKFYAEEIKIDNIFNTHLSILPRSTEYVIPESLRDVIDFVELDTKIRNATFKQVRRSLPTKCDDRFLGRESLIQLYNVTDDGVDHTVSGVLAEFQNNAGFSNDDLYTSQLANNQQKNGVSHIQGVNVGIDLESVLDVQLMSSAGNNMDIWYWNTPYWLYSFSSDYFNSENIANIVSMSWGWAQDSQCDIISCVNITSRDYVNRVNNEFLKISLRGTTILAASGDAGAPGRTNEGCDESRPINPVFPGSSPYVTSVGATYVPFENKTVNFTTPLCKQFGCITSKDEKSINFDKASWTAGGGFDLYETTTPWWQNNSVQRYLNSGVILPKDGLYNKNGRAYPDISAIGHSCPVFVQGMMQGVDGTSCSTPVVGGLLSYIHKHLWEKYELRLGFANPLLYYIQNTCETCFRDVVEGYNWCTEGGCCDDPTNYGFNATDGYDPVSGLGTINVGETISYIDNLLMRK